MGVASLNSSVWLEFCRLSQSGVKGEARRTVKSPQREKSEIAQREKENTSQVWHLTSKCLKETDGLWLNKEESEAVELRGKTNWSCLGLWGQTIEVENFTLGLEHLIKTSADNWWLRRSVRIFFWCFLFTKRHPETLMLFIASALLLLVTLHMTYHGILSAVTQYYSTVFPFHFRRKPEDANVMPG